MNRLLFLREAKIHALSVPADANIFDLIEIFTAAKKFPPLETLEEFALELHIAYSTEEAVYRSATGHFLQRNSLPPRGTPWQSPQSSTPSAAASSSLTNCIPGFPSHSLESVSPTTPALVHSPEPSANSDKKKKVKKPPPKPPTPESDQYLARYQDFMREAMRSREAAWGSAQGDVGRVWEQMKSMLFAFAGSSHQKYAQYLLETLFDLELESSPELRETLLDISHANLSGLGGKHKPCDLIQEYFNRIFEAIVQHKGREYGDRFIREAIARNLHHFQRLKANFLDGVGLAKHSSNHTKLHSTPEASIILREYHIQELGSIRVGRFGRDEETITETQFAMGKLVMRAGRLKKWIKRMMFFMGRQSDENELDPQEVPAEDNDDDEDNSDTCMTGLLCAMDMVDGRLVARTLNPDADAQAIIAALDASDDQEDPTASDDEDDTVVPQTNISDPGFATDDETEFPSVEELVNER